MPSKLHVREVQAKSILNPSRISGVAYAINPYVGCQHACSYCFARFMQRYTGHLQEEWGFFVDVKINAARILQHQLRRRRKKTPEPVLLSSVTDAYQPLERRYKITRNCLKLLQQNEFPVSILTKSDLVLRDADLLESKHENEVGLTIITLNPQVQRVFEAGAPPVNRRFKALRSLSEGGIRTYAFVGPIIPYLSTPELDELVRQLADSNVAYILFDRLNIKYGNRPVIEKAIQTHFSSQATQIYEALRPGDPYYLNLREELTDLSNQYGIEAEIIF